MPNLKLNLKIKSFALIFIFSFLALTNIQKASANWLNIPLQVSDWVAQVTGNIQQQTNGIKSYITTAKNLVNTYKSSQALIQQVKNIDLTNFAVNVSSDQIYDYGKAALGVIAGDQGVGINVNTDGKQVVTNLGSYIDNIGVNEIRKALNDLNDPVNTTPYSSELTKAVTNFSKNIADTKVGNLVTFTLPYIAREEICNDPKLKEVIQNGEPANYVRPLKAVANVDIEKACQTNNIMSAREQATFVALAKGGYGGEKTARALSDPNNTPASVIGNALAKIKSLKSNAEDTATKEVSATGLNIGQQNCFDKDGKLVDYDPTSKKATDQICYSVNTTVEQSGAVVKDRTAAALLSPYFSMLARAVATTNKTGDCGSKPKETSSVTGNTFLSALFNKASAQGLGDLSKVIKNVGGCISQASNIMNDIVNVLNIGGDNAAQAIRGEDNPYVRLSNNLNSIINSQNSQEGLYQASSQAKKDYELGNTDYTVDDLKNTLDTYKNIREINTAKLNEMVFTYAFVNLAIANSKAAIPDSRGCFIGCSKKKSTNKIIGNIKESLVGLQESAISLNKAIRATIQSLAKNNWTEQQVNKLYNEFRDTESRASDNQDSLKRVLDEALTSDDFYNLQLDWNYTPKLVDEDSDPNTIIDIDGLDLSEKQALKEEARQTRVLLVPTSEREGPYTQQNLEFLRVRAWKIYERTLDANKVPEFFANLVKTCFTNSSTILTATKCNSHGSVTDAKATEISDLLARYGMTFVKNLDPNLPLPHRAGVVNVLEPAKTLTWSELSFCNNLGLTKTICNDANIQYLLRDYTDTLNDGNPTSDQLDNYCQKVETNVAAFVEERCLNATGDLANQCQDANQRQSLIAEATEACAEPAPDSSSTAVSNTP